eukprot:TRINITY_DN4487_c1_g1_i1.p1 TRINITY_DN4487_c1_g1~~TRINITY_DN4487_c1_g1_i1.p1  ORF type:complete len:400 (-),score=81.63 TRINITY_DN4487_c1_g1_i1:202-1380(-)
MVGTPYYMSPEVCRNEPYSWKSDIWSLGCVLYELCMLKHAFESQSLMGLVYRIIQERYEPIPSFYSKELSELVGVLLTKSVASRPNADELLQQAFVKGYAMKSVGWNAALFSRSVEAEVAPPPQAPPTPGAPGAPSSKAPPTGRGDRLLQAAALAATKACEGFPKIDEHTRILILAARVRRRLVSDKLNWILALAPFDEGGDGLLSVDAMQKGLASLHAGLSEDEISYFIKSLQPGAAPSAVPLSSFEAKLAEAEALPEARRVESWIRGRLAPFSSEVAIALRAYDSDRSGYLPISEFRASLQDLLGSEVNQEELNIMELLADKESNSSGIISVDYMRFADAFGAPPPPPPPGDASDSFPLAPPEECDSQGLNLEFYTCTGAEAEFAAALRK